MTFSHCHLGWFFWGGLLNCFWGKKKHVHHQIWGDKYQNLPSVLWSFHGEILGSIPRLGPVAPLGGWSDDLWWRKWIHRDKSMGFFGISKNIWNSMTFVWVFKDDATLDVTALFGYIYIYFFQVCLSNWRWQMKKGLHFQKLKWVMWGSISELKQIKRTIDSCFCKNKASEPMTWLIYFF